MDLHNYVDGIRRSWLLLLVLAVLGAAVGAGASRLQTTTYQSTAQLYVSTQSATGVQDLSQGNTFAQEVVQSYADVVTTPIVLDPVIADLGLDLTTDELAEKVTASAALETVVLRISVTDAGSSTAADIAGSVTDRFVAVVAELTPQTPDGPSPVKITVLQAPTAPERPITPGVVGFLVVGALTGLGLGLAIVVFRVHARRPRTEDVTTGRDVALDKRPA